MSGSRATVDAQGAIYFTTGVWSETITASDLPGRIALYEGLAARPHPRTGEAGVYAANYAPKVKALQRAQKIHQTMFPKEGTNQ